MEAVKILEQPVPVSWNYDHEADVLYLSLGESRPAMGVDIGDGLVLRYDEASREMVGLTVIGLKERLIRGLGNAKQGTGRSPAS